MSRIIQLTDLHIRPPGHLVSGMLDTYELFVQAIDSLLADWHKIGPIDAVIVTGDITDTGDLESYQLFRQQIERLPAHSLLIPGNHDERDHLRRCFHDMAAIPTTGKINWVHNLTDLCLIGLDTLIEGQGGGALDDATLAFLSQAISTANNRPILLAMHHPPFASGMSFMDQIGLTGSAPLADILDAAPNNIRVICGHVHSTIISSVGNTVAISAASTCSAFPADYRIKAPIGFNSAPRGYSVHNWDQAFRTTCITLTQSSGPHPFAAQ